jgi:glycosyltransferase involved in cell wall biosynthesis
MKIAVVAAGTLPNPYSGGSPISIFALLSYLAAAGNEVALCSIRTQDNPALSVEESTARLESLGVSVKRIEPHVREERDIPFRTMVIRPPDEELFPMLADAPAIRAAVAELQPDATFVYHWGSLAASSTLRDVTPRLAAGVDLPHLPAVHRFLFEDRKRLDKPTVARALMLLAQVRAQPRLLVRLLRQCEACGDFAAHHARWLRRHGLPQVQYFRTPVPDFGGPNWREERDSAEPLEPPSIMLLGNIGGTSTNSGLPILRAMLPRLHGSYRIDIVGMGKLPPELEHPAVTLQGAQYGPDLDTWVRRAAVVLVPTPIRMGMRVRIATAFAYGACVVAHRANAAGIPELKHGENCLLGRNARELTELTMRALRDPALRRRLGDAGRATYEANFEPSVAGKPILETLERIARPRS